MNEEYRMQSYCTSRFVENHSNVLRYNKIRIKSDRSFFRKHTDTFDQSITTLEELESNNE